MRVFIEAVRAILVYTESPAELLRRKKIRREVLFQYAHDENLRVMPTDEKPILVRHILTYWGSQNVSDDYMAVRNCLIFSCKF
jgi:Domain of unknown function (DUF4518)